MRRWLGSLAALLLLRACGGGADLPVVTDAVGLLEPAEAQALADQHAVLLRDHDIDYRIDLSQDVGDLLAYGVRRFDELEVGARSRTGRGLLLVLDPEQDRVRVEVGQSLEGVYTDAFVAYLEARQMVPFFRAGRVADGILATTELVVTRAQQAELQQAFVAPDRRGAAGGGAETSAHLGAGRDESSDFRAGADVAAGATPAETVDAYLGAMRTRNARPTLDLYSRATREVMGDRVVTPAQMDALARAYHACSSEPVRHAADGTRAVVRYPVTQRLCAPWFLVREDGRWRLDLATAGRVVRFGAGNAWHFATRAQHPYEFAFNDWQLDRNGFPIER